MSRSQLAPHCHEAIRAAGVHALTLIQGPPGTGKTTVAVRILRSPGPPEGCPRASCAVSVVLRPRRSIREFAQLGGLMLRLA